MSVKSFFSILVIALMIASNASGQQRRIRTEGHKGFMEQQPLIIVDSVITDLQHFLVSPDNIKSIEVLKDSASVAVYGEKAQYGVLIIRTKNKAEVFTLANLLDEYQISEADRLLPVCIDNIMVKDSSRILTDKKEILRLEVIDDICWITPADPGPQRRYVNIVTKRSGKSIL